MQSTITNRQATNRKPENMYSGNIPDRISRSSSFAEKISNWSKRNKSTDQDLSNHPPTYTASSDGTKDVKLTNNASIKIASYRTQSSKPTSSSNNSLNANRSSHVRLVEGISKVQASGSKSRQYPPRADETVITASTASVSIQNSLSVDDDFPFYNQSRSVVDSKKTIESIQRGLPYKHHTFVAGNNTFNIDTRYNLVKVIGSGAYGVVISATDSSSSGDNKTVAIKMVPKAFQDEVDAKRILREIKLLQHFRHDNIVSIMDMMPSFVSRNIEEFNDVYIVTDLMETDLHRIIYSKQPLSADHTQYFIYQILRGLKYIHSAHVIHRDLKPSNILVNANCDLKICDFGLARGFHPNNEEREDENCEMFEDIGRIQSSKAQILTE